MNVIVAGCGRVGSQLARLFTYEGHNVVVIDRNAGSFSRLGNTFNGITLTGIAFDEEVLLEAGIDKAEAFAAVTNYDNTNLMAVQIASTVFHVPKTVARLYNPDKENTFRRLKIDYVCGTALVAEKVMLKILESGERVHLDRVDLGVKVVEFQLSDKGVGMSMDELENPGQVRMVTVLRDGKSVTPQSDLELQEGDRLVVAATPHGLVFLNDFIKAS